MKLCTTGQNGICKMPRKTIPLKDSTGSSGLLLFCFFVYIKYTGSTKSSSANAIRALLRYELDFLIFVLNFCEC